MPFSDDKITLYMTINAVGLLLLFFLRENYASNRGQETRHHRHRLSRHNVPPRLGDDWLIPLRFIRRRDVASGDCQLCEYGSSLRFSSYLFPHETFAPESGLSRDEQERFGCDLKFATDELLFLGTKDDNTSRHTPPSPRWSCSVYAWRNSRLDRWGLFSLRSSIRHSRASMPSPIQV